MVAPRGRRIIRCRRGVRRGFVVDDPVLEGGDGPPVPGPAAFRAAQGLRQDQDQGAGGVDLQLQHLDSVAGRLGRRSSGVHPANLTSSLRGHQDLPASGTPVGGSDFRPVGTGGHAHRGSKESVRSGRITWRNPGNCCLIRCSWRNWQPRRTQNPVLRGVGVRLPPSTHQAQSRASTAPPGEVEIGETAEPGNDRDAHDDLDGPKVGRHHRPREGRRRFDSGRATLGL